jgi:hypothetical protein
MKCISLTTGKQLLDEIHAVQCGVHAVGGLRLPKVLKNKI